MIQIRNGSFETNSSSMHSIVVRKSTKYPRKIYGPYIDENGVLSLWGDSMEYGRYPFQVLWTPVDKIKYYIADNIDDGDYDSLNDLITIIQKHYPEVKSIELPNRRENVGVDADENEYSRSKMHFIGYENDDENKPQYLGYNEKTKEYDIPIEYLTFTNVDSFGYVDHESAGLLKRFLKDHPNISVEEFIFNPKYMVIIDGDEYCILYDEIKLGLIPREAIEMIYQYGHDITDKLYKDDDKE